MTTPLNLETIKRAPKALLHDHLDGGLRPVTVIDIAGQTGYDGLPTTDGDELAQWFRTASHSGSLERYLEPFSHTVAVMQTPEALHRVACECVEDLAADAVVYAEVRFAPELHINRGLVVRRRHRRGACRFRRRARRRRPRPGVRSWCGAWSPRCGTPRCPARSPNSPCATGTWAWSGSTSRARRPATRRPGTWTHSAVPASSSRNAHFTVHAGEAFGLPSIWEAIQHTAAPNGSATACGSWTTSRWIRGRFRAVGPAGHGYVRDRRIPLEMCP